MQKYQKKVVVQFNRISARSKHCAQDERSIALAVVHMKFNKNTARTVTGLLDTTHTTVARAVTMGTIRLAESRVAALIAVVRGKIIEW